MADVAPWNKETETGREPIEVDHVPPNGKRYYLNPNTKPRQTRRDKFNPSKAVQRYRLFKDRVRLAKMIEVPPAGAIVTFVIPMPASWSKKKKAAMIGGPHQQVPDVDNLLKALLDAQFIDDAHIWDIRGRKLWGERGSITIELPEEA
jgi:Holliday junction resolvase RusA-like endonuclease